MLEVFSFFFLLTNDSSLSPCSVLLLCVCEKVIMWCLQWCLSVSAAAECLCMTEIDSSQNINASLFIRSHSVSCCVCFLSGWFCVSAAWNSQPFDLDNYTNANCLCPATSTGGRCQVGFYCPSGSQEPLPCPPGAFCNISGILTLLINTCWPQIHSLNNTRLIFPGNKENY